MQILHFAVSKPNQINICCIEEITVSDCSCLAFVIAFQCFAFQKMIFFTFRFVITYPSEMSGKNARTFSSRRSLCTIWRMKPKQVRFPRSLKGKMAGRRAVRGCAVFFVQVEIRFEITVGQNQKLIFRKCETAILYTLCVFFCSFCRFCHDNHIRQCLPIAIVLDFLNYTVTVYLGFMVHFIEEQETTHLFISYVVQKKSCHIFQPSERNTVSSHFPSSAHGNTAQFCRCFPHNSWTLPPSVDCSCLDTLHGPRCGRYLVPKKYWSSDPLCYVFFLMKLIFIHVTIM